MSTTRRYPLGVRPAEVPQGFPGRVDFIRSAARLEDAPHLAIPEVCFCGRSNVGKSTLLNALSNRRQLARVSSTPGRTRLLNFFNVQDKVVLTDLPGYGWAKAPKAMQAEWGGTIQAYLKDRPALVLCLLLVDSRRDVTIDEQNLFNWFRDSGRPCLVVATKSDKVPASKRFAVTAAIAKALGTDPADVIAFSSLDKSGLEAIWGTILAFAESEMAAD